LSGIGDLGNLGPTHLPAGSTFSLRWPRALTGSPFSLAAALIIPSNRSYHSASNPIICGRVSTPPARTVSKPAPASSSISSSLFNRAGAPISSDARDLVLFLLEQIFYFNCSTTPIFSSAVKYSTTNPTGTGPYSADTASRISCAFRFPSAKFNTSYAYSSPAPHNPS
jgi:hypothetical protein